MGSRGKQSAADLAIVRTGEPERLQPPAHITPRARALFVELVASVSADHFVAADRPLLARYCEAVALAEQAEAKLAEDGPVDSHGRASAWIGVWDKATKAASTAATRLRLTPHSRFDARAAARKTGRGPSAYQTRPWES